MAEGSKNGEIPYKLITFIVGIVITVVGGYLIGVVISEVVSSIHRTVLISGLVLLAAGLIVLSILIGQWLRGR
ncbi:hypothetical protein IX51_07570 [uncultured archaeon]|nr:hypothetical protein IX51_07570 [uncultured archaeon]HKJ97247.1 hypothetical protein [Thermoplasmataceae archaeon]